VQVDEQKMLHEQDIKGSFCQSERVYWDERVKLGYETGGHGKIEENGTNDGQVDV